MGEKRARYGGDRRDEKGWGKVNGRGGWRVGEVESVGWPPLRETRCDCGGRCIRDLFCIHEGMKGGFFRFLEFFVVSLARNSFLESDFSDEADFFVSMMRMGGEVPIELPAFP